MPTRKSVAALAALPLLLAPLAAQADPTVRYSITPLGTIAGGYSIPWGINESGQVIGTSFSGGGRPDYAFLFSGGATKSLGSLDGGTSHAININASGQVVGYSAFAGASQGHAFLYSAGSMRDLGTLGGHNSSANGINDAGQIVGNADRSDGSSHAFLYANGNMRDLGTLGGTSSSATEINNFGQVAGSSSLSNGLTHAFVYTNDANAAMIDLGTLAGANNYSYAAAINNRGQVVGSSGFEESANMHAFLYSNGVMTDLGASLGLSSDAFGINDLGQVVGRSYNGPSGGLSGFLYSGGTMMNLNALIDPASGWTIFEGSDINNSGQIAAYGYNALYGTQALLLNPLVPVPEPAGAGMLLAGMAALGVAARRKARTRA